MRPAGRRLRHGGGSHRRPGRRDQGDGRDATVEALQTVTTDWQTHITAGRIRVYSTPCPSVGFGSCDAPFASLFLAHQFNPFPLYSRATSSDWYASVENSRSSGEHAPLAIAGGDAVESLAETPTSLVGVKGRMVQP